MAFTELIVIDEDDEDIERIPAKGSSGSISGHTQVGFHRANMQLSSRYLTFQEIA